MSRQVLAGLLFDAPKDTRREREREIQRAYKARLRARIGYVSPSYRRKAEETLARKAFLESVWRNLSTRVPRLSSEIYALVVEDYGTTTKRRVVRALSAMLAERLVMRDTEWRYTKIPPEESEDEILLP